MKRNDQNKSEKPAENVDLAENADLQQDINVQAGSDQSVNAEDNTDEVNQKITELTNDLQRTRADFENYRKQVEAQKHQAMDLARVGTVLKFLPLVDDMERAIGTYQAELTPLRKSFEKTLKDLGLQKIASEPGVEFNPDLHEAVSIEEGDGGETEVIAETLRPGYTYDGNVLRAAMVKVTRH